jgi:pyridoxine kinase
MGVECAVLPTALLSTHTQFSGFTFHDLTGEMEPICQQWKKENLTFDAIYTGYLGSFEQIRLVDQMFDQFGGEHTMIIVDPAMADHGKLYHGFTPAFAKEMGTLCAKADLILPNLTEAVFMLGEEYPTSYDQAYIQSLLKRLCAMGAKKAAITGVSYEDGRIGFELYDRETDRFSSYFNEHLPVAFHGTGDIFSSATVGAIMDGQSAEEALQVAVDYTLECIRLTLADPEHPDYGVHFEKAIPYLIRRIGK